MSTWSSPSSHPAFSAYILLPICTVFFNNNIIISSNSAANLEPNVASGYKYSSARQFEFICTDEIPRMYLAQYILCNECKLLIKKKRKKNSHKKIQRSSLTFIRTKTHQQSRVFFSLKDDLITFYGQKTLL